MTRAASHEIAARCRYLSLDEAKAVADCLPVDGLCAVNNDNQLLDLSVRYDMHETDSIVASYIGRLPPREVVARPTPCAINLMHVHAASALRTSLAERVSRLIVRCAVGVASRGVGA